MDFIIISKLFYSSYTLVCDVMKSIVQTILGKQNILVYSFCLVYYSLLLIVISDDSFTHDLCASGDSAWFFTCGKAWMNGLIPYVDFADSKGPLLWLIYGFGYLISNRDYLGVLLISSVWYSFTAYYIFKLSNLYLKNVFKSLACVVLMSVFIFGIWFHNEIRAEDYCLLFLVVSLYYIARLIENGNSILARELYKTSVILGLCFSSLLLIKFNYAIMQGGLILYFLYFVVHHSKKHILSTFLYGLLGLSCVLVPFILYFLFMGNLLAFINEYFFNTMSTVSYGSPVKLYIADWIYILFSPKRVSLLLTVSVFCWLFGKEFSRESYFPIIGFTFFFALTVYHGLYEHYFTYCSFFVIFAVIFVISKIETLYFWKFMSLTFAVFIFVCGINLIDVNPIAFSQNVIWKSSEKQKRFHHIADRIAARNKPTVIFVGVEHGEGILAEALPGCKYYATQRGATSQMLDSQKRSIQSGKADFVCIEDLYRLSLLGLKVEDLEHHGYKMIWMEPDTTNFLFEKRSQK